MRWIDHLTHELNNQDSLCLVVISRVEGSTPRELGAMMVVSQDGFWGSIGGGMLEHDALYQAKAVLNASPDDRPSDRRFWRDYPLGPSLGQCCGGFVSVLIEQINRSDQSHWHDLAAKQSGFLILPDDAQNPVYWSDQPDGHQELGGGLVLPLTPESVPLYLYGAGHVGRAVIDVTGGLPLDRHWVDTGADRFPDDIPPDVTVISASDPAQIPQYAPKGAIHLVMSYSHQIDLEICAEVLKQGHHYKIGLIGSATKWARFRSRLKQMGFAEAVIDDIQCPVGLKAISGKEPARVALSVAGQLAEWTYADALASTRNPEDLIPLKRQPS